MSVRIRQWPAPLRFRGAVDDAAPVGGEVDPAVEIRVADDDGAEVAELVLIVVDPDPAPPSSVER